MVFSDLPRTRPRATAILLGLSAFLLYLPCLRAGFVNFDDHTVLLAHPGLYNPDSFLASLKAIFVTAFPREEPLLLRDLTWALDSYLFGFQNPFGYHLGNLIFHAMNTGLIFLLLRSLKIGPAFAFGITLFHAVLPVRTEPVCWVMGRKDVLVTCFMVLGLLAHLRFLRETAPGPRRRFYLLGLLCTLAALLSKISALVFFLVLVLVEVFLPWLDGRRAPDAPVSARDLSPRRFAKYLPHFLISLAVFFWYRNVIAQWGVLDRGVDSGSVEHLVRLAVFTPLVLLRYLEILFVPRGQSIWYDWPTIHLPTSAFHVFLSVAAAASLIATAVFLARRRKDLLFHLLAFLALMIPYLNILYIGIWVANRYVYFSSLFVLLLAADGVRAGMRRFAVPHRAVWGVGLAIFAIYGAQTIRYEGAWRNDLALWQYETTRGNPSILAWASMASAYIREAEEKSLEPEERERLYRKADDALDRGVAVFRGRHYRETAPHPFRLFYLRGFLADLRNAPLGERLADYRAAHRLRPDQPEVLRKLAETTFRLAQAVPEETERRALARESLGYVSAWLPAIRRDSTQWPFAERILALYAERFPFLADRIAPLRQTLKEMRRHGQNPEPGPA